MNETTEDAAERRSRVVRSRPILGIGVFLLVLGVVCVFLVGPNTGLAIFVLGALVCVCWAAFPYVSAFELSPTRFRARMSDPKGGVEEIAIRPADRPETELPPGRGRLRRLLDRQPRSRGSARD